VISVAISYLLAPKPKTPDEPEAAGLDQFRLPTAQVGREFPVLFGRKKITSQNVVWYGDLDIEEITEKVSSGMFSSTRVTKGYKYYLGMHMIIAHDIDYILEIAVDGKTAWSGGSAGGRISVSAEDLFGGPDQAGGLSGEIDFEPGHETQWPNDYLQSHLGWSVVPAFRGVACFVVRNFYFGTSEYIKPWEIWAQKIYDTWNPSTAQIGSNGDMNPAHIIRETLLNRRWGMGYNEADIDDTAFSNAASTLYNEGFGLSMLWDHSSSIENFIAEILKHIDGSLFTDLRTGKFTIKLVRDDYDINSIPLFDESNITKIDSFKRRTLEDITNSVTVQFWDRESGKDGSITRADIAMVSRTGSTNNTTLQYKGVANKELAEFILSRDLRGLSTPLASATILTTRDGLRLAPGDPFIFSWPRYGVEETVMRVTMIEYGEFGDSSIRIECVEDVFAIAEASYSAPPPTGWVSPINEPAPCPTHVPVETPYYKVARKLGLAETSALADDVGYASIAGTKPSGDALNAQVYYRTGSDSYLLEETKRFAPSALLTADVGILDVSFPIQWQRGSIHVDPGMWGIIDSEIIRIDAVGVDSLTVGRGCLDTVPVQHSADAVIILLSDFLATINTKYFNGNSVDLKMLPSTPKGKLPIADAPEQTVLMDSRMIRPYPPGKFRINSESEPELLVGDLSLSWVHRDRTQQLEEQILDTEDTDIGPETGTTYSTEIRRVDNDNLLYSDSGITTNANTITNTEIGYGGEIQVSLWSVRDSYSSWQKQVREFILLRTEPRVTEDSEYRMTEDNDYRIIE